MYKGDITKYNDLGSQITYKRITTETKLPLKIKNIIIYWQNYIRDVRNKEFFIKYSIMWCWVKSCDILFSYESNNYCIFPETIGVTYEKFGYYYKQIFYFYMEKIRIDLINANASNVLCDNLID